MKHFKSKKQVLEIKINMEAKLTSTGDADTRHKDKTRRQKGRDIIIYFLKLTKTEVRLKGKMHSHSFQCY